MQTVANFLAIIMAIISGASIIAAVTKTPKDDVWIGKLYKLIDICALNIGKAKMKSGDKQGKEVWVEELYKLEKISKPLYENYIFYRKAFWICFIYVLWDMFTAFGWL